MKIVRLTFLLSDMPRLSPPKLRMRHGMRHAHLFLLNLSQNLCILFSVLSLALLPHLFPLNNSSPRESASAFADYPRSHFSVSQPKALCSRARGYPSKLRRATCFKDSYSSFCSPFSPAEFLAAALTLLIHCHWLRQSCLLHAKASSLLWHGFSSSHFPSFLVFVFHSFHLEDIFHYFYP